MKQQMSAEQIQLTAVHALQIPRYGMENVNDFLLDVLHRPLASAINHLRELGTAQLIVRACDNDVRADDFRSLLDAFLRELLDTVQLPGEKIEFEVKTGAKTGLIVVTLFTEQPNT